MAEAVVELVLLVQMQLQVQEEQVVSDFIRLLTEMVSGLQEEVVVAPLLQIQQPLEELAGVEAAAQIHL
jgi:hypothetical protein